jgi:hypothetical protein
MLMGIQLGVKTTTIEEYISREDWSAVIRDSNSKSS